MREIDLRDVIKPDNASFGRPSVPHEDLGSGCVDSVKGKDPKISSASVEVHLQHCRARWLLIQPGATLARCVGS